MNTLHSLQKGSVGLVALLLASPALAADPPGILLQGITGSARTLTPDDIMLLPAIQVSVAFGAEHGARQARFEGPLLYTVLVQTGAIDPAKPREQVRTMVAVAGHDGYTATLALGEISPAFEDKQVVIADKEDGKPLEPGHFRLVVPADHHGGRSVHDVASLTVTSLPTPAGVP